MRLRGSECVQYRALWVGGEQCGFDGAIVALLLSQKLVVPLENRSLYRALNFAGQALFQVEALGAGLGQECAIGEAIQWVVVVTAEQRFVCGVHGLCSVKIRIAP
jgi:hypothetical protein